MKPHSMPTAEEELFKSEVLWPEARHDAPASALGSSSVASSRNHQSCPTSSRPVDIPHAARLPRGRADRDEEEEEEENGGCGAMVPPHVMVSRRRSEGKGVAAVAFSLRSGSGRERRDLSHLRNSVLRMTGFIEG